jgi:hypothetical protein
METGLPATTGPTQAPADLDGFTLAYLRAHEAECPACGYNVHALTQPRCPECGRGLVVQVTTAAGFSWQWIMSLVVSSLGAGVGLLVLLVVLGEGMHEPSNAIRFVLFYFMGNIPLPLMVLATRRRFLRLWPVVQNAIGGILILATVGMMTWFIGLILRL